jgi:pimeloyl-ACP methyl ester carboxylesterase
MTPLRLPIIIASLLVCLFAGWSSRGQDQAAPAANSKQEATAAPSAANLPANNDRRRVYVMHSGVHTILANSNKNIAAASLKEGLLKRGVAAKDIVVLDNPYPTANWRNMFPPECVPMFAESAMPESRVAQDAYQRLHKALKAQGVSVKDDVVWIGHSAGGQMGLTMAHLGKNLEKHADLVKSTLPYNFDMVILLGSPIAANLLPPEIKLRHYFSPQDRVVRWAVRYSSTVMWAFGYRLAINAMPPNLDVNDKVRIFRGVEHPYWDVDSRVLDRIVAETNPHYQPLWCSPTLNPGLDKALMRLVSRAVEDRYRITFEEAPWK